MPHCFENFYHLYTASGHSFLRHNPAHSAMGEISIKELHQLVTTIQYLATSIHWFEASAYMPNAFQSRVPITTVFSNGHEFNLSQPVVTSVTRPGL